MRSRALLLALTLLLTASAPALAQDAPPPPDPTATAPPPPAVPGPVPPAQAKVTASLRSAYRLGKRTVAFVGQQFAVSGTVTPYVAGQSVEIAISRGHRVTRRQTIAIRPSTDGTTGTFSMSLRSKSAGNVTVKVTHAATDAQQEFASSPLTVTLVSTKMHSGSHGLGVSFLQARLAALHFAVPRSGHYDAATGRAVLAYRKVNRMDRNESVNKGILYRLGAGRGGFRPKHPKLPGHHIEADLSRQVLVLMSGKSIYRIYVLSSGKPSTPTVLGTFHVYSKTPGTNAEGMVDANYFIRGYAIHGYAEVPAYAASHGCLRVPIPDAGAIFAWVRTGDRIDVYR